MKPSPTIVTPEQDALMTHLASGVRAFLTQSLSTDAHRSQARRVLFLPSYYMIPYTRMRDFLIAAALVARGAELISVDSSDFHPDDCVLYGGLYGKTRRADMFRESEIENELLYKKLEIKAVQLSDYRTEEDIAISESYALATNFSTVRSISRSGYPVGEKAAAVTMNLNNIGRLDDRPELLPQLRTHVKNIIELQLAYERLFEQLHPESVMSNVAYYYRWGVPFHVARQRNVPFYSFSHAEKKDAVVFQSNTDRLFDVSAGWPAVRDRHLTSEEERFIDQAVQLRFDANVAHFQTQFGFPKAGDDSSEKRALFERLRAHGGPVALLPSNVLCDAPVYIPCPAFNSLTDLIEQTIQFFRAHPQYQLIIKAHPVEKTFEQDYLKDVAKESVANTLVSWIKHKKIDLPSNVIVLDAHTRVSALDIIPYMHVGVCYSSSVAVETALLGKPMISVADAHYQGKGLTLQPSSHEEFFSLLQRRLESHESAAEQAARRDSARRYYLLYYGYASIDWGLLQGSDMYSVEDKILIDSVERLLPGNNPALDYICESVLSGLPALGRDRLPPLT